MACVIGWRRGGIVAVAHGAWCLRRSVVIFAVVGNEEAMGLNAIMDDIGLARVVRV